MRTSDLAVLAFAALIAAGIFAISPDVRATSNRASTQPHSFSLSGVSRNATYSPEEDLPAH